MITEQEYNNALNIVNQYRKQITSSIDHINIYEWLKVEMMFRTDITEEEFEELLDRLIHIKKKELDINKYNQL